MSSEILLATAISNFLLVGIGGFFIYLSAKTEKLVQVLQADSVNHRRESLIELQEIRNAIIDLTDATEDLDIPAHLSANTTPDIMSQLPLPVQLGLSILKQMKEGRPDFNGSEASSERQIYEVQETNSEDFESDSDEETQNTESSNQDITTG